MFLKQLHRTLNLGMATVAFILAIAVTASVTTAGSPKSPMESALTRAASAPEEMVSS